MGRAPELRALWTEAVRQGSAAPLAPLRWANLGVNYVWGKREYEAGNSGLSLPIPDELEQLARAVAEPLGLDIEPEAGIVNYYPHDGVMGGEAWVCE
jgi:hypothetical protein